MKLIAHRGNIDGPNPLENHPDHLLTAQKLGFDCEVDVWMVEGKIFLGHDAPMYLVKESFLQTKGFWLHAKNLDALDFLLKKNLHCFWHETDKYTLTSQGYIWANLGMPVSNKTVLVSLNINDMLKSSLSPYGICSDHALQWVKTQ